MVAWSHGSYNLENQHEFPLGDVCSLSPGRYQGQFSAAASAKPLTVSIPKPWDPVTFQLLLEFLDASIGLSILGMSICQLLAGPTWLFGVQHSMRILNSVSIVHCSYKCYSIRSTVWKHTGKTVAKYEKSPTVHGKRRSQLWWTLVNRSSKPAGAGKAEPMGPWGKHIKRCRILPGFPEENHLQIVGLPYLSWFIGGSSSREYPYPQVLLAISELTSIYRAFNFVWVRAKSSSEISIACD